MAMDQARWNAITGVRCEFLLLNPPCPNEPQDGRDFVILDPNVGNVADQLNRLSAMLTSNGPRSSTPLTMRLVQLRERLLRDRVGADGTRIMLCVVTDGLPTAPQSYECRPIDQSAYTNELKTFAATFNCFIVIRLCTDEDTIVEYYNKVDEEMELPLDILDDLRGEAQEVRDSGNGWFAYTPLIHRIREGGTMAKIFDLLDERTFTVVEIATFLEYLLRGPCDAPFPRTHKELYAVAKAANARAPLVYDGLTGQMAPPVNMKRLQKALGQTTWGRAKAVPGRMVRQFRCLIPGKRRRA